VKSLWNRSQDPVAQAVDAVNRLPSASADIVEQGQETDEVDQDGVQGSEYVDTDDQDFSAEVEIAATSDDAKSDVSSVLSEARSYVSNSFKTDDKDAQENVEENFESEGFEMLSQLRRLFENTPEPDDIDNFVSDAEDPLYLPPKNKRAAKDSTTQELRRELRSRSNKQAPDPRAITESSKE
jgi:predicted small lipoprotein YifL